MMYLTVLPVTDSHQHMISKTNKNRAKESQKSHYEVLSYCVRQLLYCFSSSLQNKIVTEEDDAWISGEKKILLLCLLKSVHR